ncbi:MAG: hypothetical protein IT237_10680 [Bacteroidia bacterium]|nr:hypothetical protein [Bacteroidia bacterium]
MLQINLKAELTADIRTFKAPQLALYILKHQLIDELIAFAMDTDALLSSRAMWVLGHCSDIDYDCIAGYHQTLINNLKREGLHNGVIRNTLRLYQKHPVPSNQESFMFDTCMKYFTNPSQAIAVRTFAITVAYHIALQYPELLNEFTLLITHLPLADEPPAIQSRVRNTLKAMAKIQKLKHSL